MFQLLLQVYVRHVAAAALVHQSSPIRRWTMASSSYGQAIKADRCGASKQLSHSWRELVLLLYSTSHSARPHACTSGIMRTTG
eukprot:7324478-Pyramimonas_sp.AAC.2